MGLPDLPLRLVLVALGRRAAPMSPCALSRSSAMEPESAMLSTSSPDDSLVDSSSLCSACGSSSPGSLPAKFARY